MFADEEPQKGNGKGKALIKLIRHALLVNWPENLCQPGSKSNLGFFEQMFAGNHNQDYALFEINKGAAGSSAISCESVSDYLLRYFNDLGLSPSQTERGGIELEGSVISISSSFSVGFLAVTVTGNHRACPLD